MTTICTRCVMDSDCPRIQFDGNGVCNYCKRHEEEMTKRAASGDYTPDKLDALVETIKEEGQGKDFDCVLGVSGGFDSSYVALWAKEHGLRVLCTHLDNGWDTVTANRNIENLVNKLGFALHTEVLDWEEFKDIQLSFMKASVVDIELPTDIAIFACFFETAYKIGTRFILNGSNPLTESGHFMPVGWNHYKFDYLNIVGIHHRYGTRRMLSFPLLDQHRYQLYRFRNNITVVDPLLYMPNFDMKNGKQRLKKELGWEDYGQKHSESLFTKFYQRYILPEKFGVDKRKSHYSTMVMTNTMSRDEALTRLAKPAYNPEELERDKAYVMKKLGLTESEFSEIMSRPIRQHTEFPSEAPPHAWEK